jgi:general stress protein 26
MKKVDLVPYESLPDAAWNRLNQAANDPRQPMRLMSVATVTPQGRPSNRILVLRGADRAAGLLWFHADRRSPKIAHLKERPYMSVLGYEEEGQVQIRADGEVTLHHHDVLADRHWEQASMAVRRAYGLPEGPGESIHQPDPRSQMMRKEQNLGNPEHGRENFIVLQLRVEVLDWLQVGANGQVRAVMHSADGFKPRPVVP